MKSVDLKTVDELVKAALGEGITREQALAIARCSEDELNLFMAGSAYLTRRAFSNKVQLCSIINAKSGRCDQDCAFCAQSSHHDAQIDKYGMVDTETIIKAAMSAKGNGATEFSVVTSGRELNGDELETACRAVKAIETEAGLKSCVSLGIMSPESLARLVDSGLSNFHHNLETSSSNYGHICTTRTFEDNVKAVMDAKAAGIKTCCGGIFGMGETRAQRVELAFELKELGVESVPLNFLNPIEGTPLEFTNELTPIECLRIICMFRYVLPEVKLVLCGGREQNLRQLQPLAFAAGASGMMIGNYLTTKGRDPKLDLQMLQDLGLKPAGGMK